MVTSLSFKHPYVPLVFKVICYVVPVFEYIVCIYARGGDLMAECGDYFSFEQSPLFPIAFMLNLKMKPSFIHAVEYNCHVPCY